MPNTESCKERASPGEAPLYFQPMYPIFIKVIRILLKGASSMQDFELVTAKETSGEFRIVSFAGIDLIDYRKCSLLILIF